jgi:ABC-type spermidine/putrescine transport system permease subunit I
LQSNIFDDFINAIQKFSSDYGILGLIVLSFVIILMMLWIFLPFAVYPLHASIRRCSRELRVLNRKIDQLIINTAVESKKP